MSIKRTRSANTRNATWMSLCVTFQRTQSPQGALIWLRKKRDSVTMAAFQRGMHIRSPRISHKRLREHGRACISFTPFLSYLSCLLHPSSSHHPSLLPGRFLYRHGCTTLPISSTAKRSETIRNDTAGKGIQEKVHRENQSSRAVQLPSAGAELFHAPWRFETRRRK